MIIDRKVSPFVRNFLILNRLINKEVITLQKDPLK